MLDRFPVALDLDQADPWPVALPACKGCTHGVRPLGRLHGIDMGSGRVRLTTHPDCPRHSLCREFTAAFRDGLPSWAKPYCPQHPKRPCPEREAQ